MDYVYRTDLHKHWPEELYHLADAKHKADAKWHETIKNHRENEHDN